MRSRGRRNWWGNWEREAREQERVITTESKEVILLFPPHLNVSLITLQFSPELCNSQHKVRITIKRRKRNWNETKSMKSAHFEAHDFSIFFKNEYPWYKKKKQLPNTETNIYPELDVVRQSRKSVPCALSQPWVPELTQPICRWSPFLPVKSRHYQNDFTTEV